MAQRVGTEVRNGRVIHQLFDDESGASASVLPSYGFNLFDLNLPVAGQVRSIVYAAEGWASAPSVPGRNGIPVLFPFPNRIQDGRYEFGGRSYQLPLNKPPHAIHGFAIDAEWVVVDHAAGPDGATITGAFQISKNAPNALALWPSDARIALTYTLKGRRLTLDVAVSNRGDVPLPWGFGIHPYFRLPFTPGADLEATAIVASADQYWVLDGSIPTGEIRPVDADRDFRRGRSIDGLKIDDVLTNLAYEGNIGVARLIDRNLGSEFRMSYDRNVRELVLFTPPNPPGVIAVEPYTMTTDAIRLQALGVDAGLRILGPGDESTFRIGFETAETSA